MERELRRRDAILDAVRFAAERLLGEAVGWEESIRAVLGRLGEATGGEAASTSSRATRAMTGVPTALCATSG